MNELLKQFTVKRNRLHYIRGPNTGKPAGHKRQNGVIYVRFNGYLYNHDDLLFLYNEQSASKSLNHIDTKEQYETISGHQIILYSNRITNAPPYVIHGAILIKNQWHACQWTKNGEAVDPQFNLTKVTE